MAADGCFANGSFWKGSPTKEESGKKDTGGHSTHSESNSRYNQNLLSEGKIKTSEAVNEVRNERAYIMSGKIEAE